MRRRSLAAALLTAAAALTGCARVLPGTGTAVALRAASAAHFPSAPAAPSATPATTPAPPPSPRTHSQAPQTTPAAGRPAVCAGGQCRRVASAGLDGDYRVTVYAAPSPTGAVAATVTELARAGVPVYWHVTDDASPSRLMCSPTPQPNCGLSVFVGAHASEGFALLRAGDALALFGQANSETPTTKVVDLDGDGWVDVATVRNTYRPSYATGKVYWQTFTADGRRLTATGCTAPTHELMPTPTAPLTGPCPPS